jgi:hypothetical protein
MQPILAWDIAPDGAVYVLDAAQRIYELDPTTLASVHVSARLVPLVSDSSAQLVATSDQIFVAASQFDGIQVLDRASLESASMLPPWQPSPPETTRACSSSARKRSRSTAASAAMRSSPCRSTIWRRSPSPLA